MDVLLAETVLGPEEMGPDSTFGAVAAVSSWLWTTNIDAGEGTAP